MKNIKIYLITIASIILSVLLIATMTYINILNEQVSVIIKDITILVIILISGLILGRKKDKLGFIEGLKLGSIISLILLILRLIIKRNILFKKIIFYILIILVSTVGSIIGINKK